MTDSSSGTEERRIEIKLSVRSHHSAVPAAGLVKPLDDAVQEFSDSLPPEHQARITVDREKTYPIGVETVVVTVAIYVGLKVADTVISKITEEVYDWVSKKLKDKGTVSRTGDE